MPPRDFFGPPAAADATALASGAGSPPVAAGNNFGLSPLQWMLLNTAGGILASNKPGATFGQALGGGLQRGAQAAAMLPQMQSAQQQQMLRNLQVKQLLEEQKRSAGLRSRMQALAAGDAGAAEALGLTPGQAEALKPVAGTGDVETFSGALKSITTRKPDPFSMYLAGDPRGLAWQHAKAPRTSITNKMLPDLKPGERFVMDDAGNIIGVDVIPGSSLDIKRQKEARQEAQRVEMGQRYGKIALDDLSQARALAQQNPTWTTGLLGDFLKGVGGTSARDLAGKLKSIKAYISFNRLQQMRDASPTGGALGQVSNVELDLLSSAYGDMEQSQSAEQLVYNLNRFEGVLNDIIHGPGSAPSAPTPAPDRPATAEQADYRWDPESNTLVPLK